MTAIETTAGSWVILSRARQPRRDVDWNTWTQAVKLFKGRLNKLVKANGYIQTSQSPVLSSRLSLKTPTNDVSITGRLAVLAMRSSQSVTLGTLLL